jgi:hypothetical protein
MSEDYPKCLTCAYSNEGPAPADGNDGKWLLCCRYPPVVFRAADDGYTGGAGVFPRVDRDDWCGEWVECAINTGRLKQTTFLSSELAIAKDEFAKRGRR